MKNEDIGKLLKELRIKHGYTQAELANLLNVTYQAVSRWEKGINTPNLLTLVALKKLYKISIDELLLEVERKIVEPVEKKLHWTIQYFLLPLALIILSFGIAQFYFFLNVFFAMIIFSIFIGVILSAVMLLIKFKQKGILFLIVLGLLMLINGTVYITNLRYFNLMEVPYYQESDHLILPFDYTNSIPINIDYILDDEPYVLIYHLGKPNIQTYQLESNLSQMMTNIDTINLEIDDMVIIGEYAYFSTYFEDSSTSDIYQMNLRTHEILFLTTLNMQIELCESDTSLYIYESYGGFLDFETTILRWNGVAIEEVVSFDFEIVDMLYNDSLERFYISVNQNNVYNIRIYDDQF
ncbi:MAG: XRE family transcriptional regulator, partial [Bacillota bacterium]